MNKKLVLWILLDLIFLIVFNTVFFTAGGFDYPTSAWLSYLFIHFAYIMVLATPFLIRKSNSSAVFTFSVGSISSTYFLIEFVVGVIFIFLKRENIRLALIVQIIIAGAYAIVLLSHLLANERTADSVERREKEVTFIKVASSMVKNLIDKSDNKKSRKEIERVYDLLHSSPTWTNANVNYLEMEIQDYILELESAVMVKDDEAIINISEALIKIVRQRNNEIKYEFNE